MRSIRIVLATFVLLAGTLEFANACEGRCCCGHGFSGFGVSGNLYGLGKIPVPPYFALHPPVYYSGVVARPYGASPFAAAGGRIETIKSKPTTITNPFVAPTSLKKMDRSPQRDRVTQLPKLIRNPFVNSPIEVVIE